MSEVRLRLFPHALSEEEILLLHEGEIRPLTCRRCGLSFTSRSRLMRHVWEAHRKGGR